MQPLESRQLLAVSTVTPDFRVPGPSDGFEDPGIVDVTGWSSDPAVNADPAPGNNDYVALQAAIDRFSGTGKILYFPAGEYEIDRTLVARSLQGFDYRPVSDAPGDLFIYDVVNGSYEFRNQNVWARQLNVEGAADVTRPDVAAQKILNDNSRLWVLGLKIENEGTVVRTINGGFTELLGVYRNNSTFSDEANPALRDGGCFACGRELRSGDRGVRGLVAVDQ